jgi:hypothetical protein
MISTRDVVRAYSHRSLVKPCPENGVLRNLPVTIALVVSVQMTQHVLCADGSSSFGQSAMVLRIGTLFLRRNSSEAVVEGIYLRLLSTLVPGTMQHGMARDIKQLRIRVGVQ